MTYKRSGCSKTETPQRRFHRSNAQQTGSAAVKERTCFTIVTLIAGTDPEDDDYDTVQLNLPPGLNWSKILASFMPDCTSFLGTREAKMQAFQDYLIDLGAEPVSSDVSLEFEDQQITVVEKGDERVTKAWTTVDENGKRTRPHWGQAARPRLVPEKRVATFDHSSKAS